MDILHIIIYVGLGKKSFYKLIDGELIDFWHSTISITYRWKGAIS